MRVLSLIIKKEIHMPTNPIGKNTKAIGINMSKKMADELEAKLTLQENK